MRDVACETVPSLRSCSEGRSSVAAPWVAALRVVALWVAALWVAFPAMGCGGGDDPVEAAQPFDGATRDGAALDGGAPADASGGPDAGPNDAGAIDGALDDGGARDGALDDGGASDGSLGDGGAMTCGRGFADCDRDVTNGCERYVGRLSCGGPGGALPVIAGLVDPRTSAFYRRSYGTMRRALRRNTQLQVFSGTGLLAEFDADVVYAGHMGAIWSPPFYSAHMGPGQSDPARQADGFQAALVFHDRDAAVGRWEQASDPAREAYWSPAALTASARYGGTGGGFAVATTRTALADHAFAMELVITNERGAPLSLSTAVVFTMATLDRLETWDPATALGWNWGVPPSRSATTASFDPSAQAVILANAAGNAYAAVGLGAAADTAGFDLTDDLGIVARRFYDTGLLNNSDAERNDVYGASAALMVRSPALAPGASRRARFIVALGATAAQASARLVRARSETAGGLAARAETLWRDRATYLDALPAVDSSNEVLRRHYYNSALAYSLNRWKGARPSDDSLGECSFFGHSNALFTWLTGTHDALVLADPPFFRGVLVALLSMDYGRCRAYQPIRGQHLCDVTYASSLLSLVHGIYRYVALTGDRGLLDQGIAAGGTVAGFLATFDRAHGEVSGLVDFGNDRRLYEFDIHCTGLAGYYVGKVPSANAERILALQEAAELLELRGDTRAPALRSRAVAAAAAFDRELYDAGSGFYDVLRPTAGGDERVTFDAVATFHALDVPGLMRPAQVAAMLDRLERDFISPSRRFTSLPTSYATMSAPGRRYCSRADWHGPGLYSGEVGAMMHRLFRNDRKELAAELLYGTPPAEGYGYLADVPLTHQAYAWNTEQFPDGQAVAYLEGISIAQSLLAGLFGIDASAATGIVLRPRIPADVGFPLVLRRAVIQGVNLSLGASASDRIAIALRPARPGNGLAFRYEPDEAGHLVTLVAEGMLARTRHRIRVRPDGRPAFTVAVTTDGSGRLSHVVPVAVGAAIDVQVVP